jgi:amidohydrolase
MESVNKLQPEDFQLLVELRRELHQYPEVAHHEHLTAERLSKWAEKHLPSFRVIRNLGNTGVLMVQNNSSAKTRVIFRAELDALPIREDADSLDYASKHEGKSHKCGHDGHMTMVCGLGLLVEKNPLADIQVGLLFQPAEETGEGAELVKKSQAFQDFNPDVIYALHNLPEHPFGQVMIKSGSMCMASTGVWLHIEGATSHAAEPFAGTSPLPVLQDCQKVWQYERERNGKLQVSTIVHLQLGEPAFGTTPGSMKVALTLRAETDADLNVMLDELRKQTNDSAKKHHLSVKMQTVEAFAAVMNTDEETEEVITAAENLNYDHTIMDAPTRWSEDVGELFKGKKGALFCLGSGENTPVLHHPTYDFPDKLIPYGSQMYYQLLLQKHEKD